MGAASSFINIASDKVGDKVCLVDHQLNQMWVKFTKDIISEIAKTF